MLASLIETHALLKNTNSNAEPSIQDTGFLFPKEAKKAIDEAAADAAAEAETRVNLEREEKVAALTKLDLPVKRDWEDGAEKAEKIDNRNDREEKTTAGESDQMSEAQKKQELIKQKRGP